MGGGGEWPNETMFREVWLFRKESWGICFGRQGQEHFSFVFSQQRCATVCVMFTRDSVKGRRGVDNWRCPIACVEGCLQSTEDNDQCPSEASDFSLEDEEGHFLREGSIDSLKKVRKSLGGGAWFRGPGDS